MYSEQYVKLSVRLPNYSGSETVKRNSSISRPYIFYQMFTVGSSILGPASVTLMIAGRSQILVFRWFVSNSKTASNLCLYSFLYNVYSSLSYLLICCFCFPCVFLAGAFQFVFKIAGTLSIIIACVPPVFYVIICFVAKPDNQITIAGILSILYAFLMTASFFSIIGGWKHFFDSIQYVLIAIKHVFKPKYKRKCPMSVRWYGGSRHFPDSHWCVFGFHGNNVHGDSNIAPRGIWYVHFPFVCFLLCIGFWECCITFCYSLTKHDEISSHVIFSP